MYINIVNVQYLSILNKENLSLSYQHYFNTFLHCKILSTQAASNTVTSTFYLQLFTHFIHELKMYNILCYYVIFRQSKNIIALCNLYQLSLSIIDYFTPMKFSGMLCQDSVCLKNGYPPIMVMWHDLLIFSAILARFNYSCHSQHLLLPCKDQI